jgi:hypothetical protein
MDLIFKTPVDSPDSVEIVGAGVVPAFGKGGLPVSRVELPELAGVDDKDRDAAVKAWAEGRGLVAVAASKGEIDTLTPPENDLRAIGRAAYVKLFGEDRPAEPAPQTVDLKSTEAKGASA